MKSLDRWKYKQTTLRVGRETYTGVVTREKDNSIPSGTHQYSNATWRYVFKTDNGKEIPISSRRVMVKDGGLVIRVDNGQPIKTLQKTY